MPQTHACLVIVTVHLFGISTTIYNISQEFCTSICTIAVYVVVYTHAVLCKNMAAVTDSLKLH